MPWLVATTIDEMENPIPPEKICFKHFTIINVLYDERKKAYQKQEAIETGFAIVKEALLDLYEQNGIDHKRQRSWQEVPMIDGDATSIDIGIAMVFDKKEPVKNVLRNLKKIIRDSVNKHFS
jgi:hypothetical protein